MKVLKKIARRECYKRMGFNRTVAAYVGNANLVRNLLEKGMDPHAEDSLGRSAIWWGKHGWAPNVCLLSFSLWLTQTP